MQDANKLFKEQCIDKWEQTYQETETGEHYKTFQPSVYKSIDMSKMPRRYQTLIFRLQTGHCGLRAYLYKIGKVESPHCSYCLTEETVSHFILHCPAYENERNHLKEKVEELKAPFEIRILLSDTNLMSYVAEFTIATTKKI